MVALPPLLGLPVCAGVAWLLGLRIRRTLDAPALTARIQRHRRRCAFLYLIVALAVMFSVRWISDAPTLAILLPPATVFYAILGAVACAAGDYPLRRDAFGERCGFAASVRFTMRTTLGMAAFWIALVAAPFVVHACAPHEWPAAVAVFLLLLGWAWRSVPLMLALLGARPVDPNPRFDEIVARSSAAVPVIRQFGPPGAAWANAFALPDLERPAVAFSTPLLERLTADEAAAIFAHEVAHLEDFDAKRLKQLGRTSLLVIGIAAFISPLGARAGLAWGAVAGVWAVVFFAFLFQRLAGMKKKETESDRRAIELCGDAEALARGLERLHDLNHVPRRLDVDTEKASTHPSLARRLADIRRASDPRTPAPVATAFRARDGSRVVVFEPAQLVALRLGPGDRDAPDLDDLNGLAARAERRDALAYRDLVALHVTLDRKGGGLRAVERDGTERSVPLATADLDACRRAIDRVDDQFAALEELRRPPKAYAALAAAGACLGIVASEDSGAIAMLLLLLVGLVAMLRMRSSWFGALGAGAAALGFGAMLFATDRASWVAETWLLLAAGAASGVLCLRLAFRRPGLQRGSPQRLALLLALGGLPLAVAAGLSLARPHTWLTLAALADASPGWFLPFVMAAGALAQTGGRRAWTLAAMLAVVGLAHHALGSDWFLRNVAQDPLARALPEPTLEEIAFEVRREVALAGRFRGLTLAPNGRAFTTVHADRAHVDGARQADTVVLADFDGRVHRLRALAHRFVDDERVLVLKELQPPRLAVQLRAVDDPYRVVWAHEIDDAPPLVHAELAVDGAMWRVVVDRDGAEPMRYRGTIARAGATTDRPPARLVASHTHRHAFADTITGFAPRTLSIGENVFARTVLRLHVRHPVVAADGRGRRRFWRLEDGALAPGFEIPLGMDWAVDGTRIASVRAHAVDVVEIATRRGVTVPLKDAAHWNVAVALCRDGIGLGFQGSGTLRVVVLKR